MKRIFDIGLFLLVPALSVAQCPVTSPTADLTITDGGSPNCDAARYKYVGQVSPNGAGNCMNFSGSSCGIAYYGSTYSLTCDFCVTFDFTLSTFTSDGIAFTMADFSQTSSGNPCSSPLDACAAGGNIGYNTFTNSASNLNGGGALTVEIDVFDNSAQGDDDPACDHVSIVQDGNNNVSEAQACAGSNLDDGASHSVSICWDPVNDVLTVDIDGTNLITFNSDIAATYFTGTDVHFAFSSGYNPSFIGTNQVCNWDVMPLPIVLDLADVVFSAELEEKDVRLEWFDPEGSGCEYVVERGQSTNDFKAISQPISNEAGLQFEFTDKEPASGTYYYRIKRIAPSGQVEYSKVLFVQVISEPNFEVFQVGNQLRINSSKGVPYAIYIYDIDGKLVDQFSDFESQDLNLDYLSKGLFIVRLQAMHEVISKKIIVLND